VLSLTGEGERLLAQVQQRSRDEITRLIERMPEADQRRLVQALQSATRVLAGRTGSSPIILRGHRPGDMGWVVEAHGRFYAEEFGWDGRFEALIAEIVAGFLRTFDPAHERCWIAEQDGERVGSVFVVRQDDGIAKLRLLLVDPAVRGAGLGRTLVRECIAFARATGYRHLRLWTNHVLTAARAIYESEGFALIDASPHADFGIPMIGETWDLKL
jgi:GNAT superfamily N-acetyltransferase